MAWAQEMKSLVSDIKTSTRDRLQFVKDNQKDTRDLLARFDSELKELAQDLRHFLDKSEKDRMSDFHKIMKDIHEGIKSIQERVKSIFGDTGELLARFDKELKEMAKDLKDFLAKSEQTRAKSEQTRMADFKVMMKDIQSRVNDIQKHVAGLLGDYAEERKEAHASWGVLRKREMAIAEAKSEEAEKEAKKTKKSKS